jgi:hypothetical protein
LPPLYIAISGHKPSKYTKSNKTLRKYVKNSRERLFSWTRGVHSGREENRNAIQTEIGNSALNGAKSRGPTATAGKEKSSQNAVKHGLTSQSAVVLACESQEEFDEILNKLMEIHKPANAAELDLVQEMVVCRWRIRRFWGIETTLLDEEIFNKASQSPFDKGLRVYLAQAFRSLADDSRSGLSPRATSLARTASSTKPTPLSASYSRCANPKPPASPPPGVGPAQPAPDPLDLGTAKGTQAPTNPPESNQMPPDPPATTHNPQPLSGRPTATGQEPSAVLMPPAAFC